MPSVQVLLMMTALVAVGFLLPPAAALNFHQPSLKGQALDYCMSLSPAAGCGAPAADAWCKALGYDRTTSFTGPTAATTGRTTAIESKEECVSSAGTKCSTFVAINCIREKLFIEPRVDGKLLDWCLEGSKGCGRPAASDFCVNQGFSHGAWSYGDYLSSPFEDTFQPKTRRTCNSKTEECRAFSTIFCER